MVIVENGCYGRDDTASCKSSEFFLRLGISSPSKIRKK